MNLKNIYLLTKNKKSAINQNMNTETRKDFFEMRGDVWGEGVGCWLLMLGGWGLDGGGEEGEIGEGRVDGQVVY